MIKVLNKTKSIHIELLFHRLSYILAIMALLWYNTLPQFFKVTCWFIVNKPPSVISFNVVGTVLILFRYLHSQNISVVHSLSSKIHDFILSLFSCWYNLHPPIWTYCYPSTAPVWFIIVDTVSVVAVVDCSVVSW